MILTTGRTQIFAGFGEEGITVNGGLISRKKNFGYKLDLPF
jgi:hypothetical protein